MQVSKSWGKNTLQNLKNRSFIEKIGLSEYALKIGVTPKKSEHLAAMQMTMSLLHRRKCWGPLYT